MSESSQTERSDQAGRSGAGNVTGTTGTTGAGDAGRQHEKVKAHQHNQEKNPNIFKVLNAENRVIVGN